MGPMDMKSIIALLNKHQYQGRNDWQFWAAGVTAGVGGIHKMTAERAEEVARVLAGLVDTPAPPAEPSVEQCVEAVIRAKHRGQVDWRIEVVSTNSCLYRLNRDELMGLGKLLIERERTEAAKGGA